LRSNRDEQDCEGHLGKIRAAAAGEKNLFPLVIEAVKAGCTLGEIMQAMKDVFGTWMAPSGF